MVFNFNKIAAENVYNCWVEKEKSRINPPIWWLKGLEIVVQGADVYDEVRYVAFGDSPEELLILAKINGLDIAKSQEL
jgi:hypothetical protein